MLAGAGARIRCRGDLGGIGAHLSEIGKKGRESSPVNPGASARIELPSPPRGGDAKLQVIDPMRLIFFFPTHPSMAPYLLFT